MKHNFKILDCETPDGNSFASEIHLSENGWYFGAVTHGPMGGTKERMYEQAKANAERICLCVEYCKNMSNEDLEYYIDGMSAKAKSNDRGEEVMATQIIFNGGEHLSSSEFFGLSDDSAWHKAKEWEDKANETQANPGIEWSFDCGFKLDYDGAALSVSSRFYPPKSSYGDKWDGTISIIFMGDKAFELSVEEETLEKLKISVETKVNNFLRRVELFLDQLHDATKETK